MQLALPATTMTPNTTPSSSPFTSNDQWRVFLGIALLIASYVFRVEVVRFTLRLGRRGLPSGLWPWIKEFEKALLYPLSWVVFVLLVWFSTWTMNLPGLLQIEPPTIGAIIRFALGFPLIWVVICFCNYVTWGIVRIKGWNRKASTDDDDYNRVMIITEGIGVIKMLLIAAVVSSFMIDGIGEMTKFDSSQISTVAILVVELVFVFGGHTWLKNTMGGLLALVDEQIKSGLHVLFQDHEGVVERLFLQCFALRRYDKSVAYIPNGMLLEHTLEIKTKNLDRQTTVEIRLDHSVTAPQMRVFIQELDVLMLRLSTERQSKRKSTVLGLEARPRGGWDIFGVVQRTKALTADEVNDSKPRFWIGIASPFVVQVTYCSHEVHVKQVMAEKTAVVLAITELVASLDIKLLSCGNSPTETSTPLPLASVKMSTLRAPASEPTIGTDSIKRFASESNVLRQRRPNSGFSMRSNE